MEEARISLDTPGGPMPLYVASPGAAATRAVIVIQEAFGVTEHIEDITRRFASIGYVSVAPHIFHRTGGGVFSYDDVESIRPHFLALTAEGVLEDIDATLAYLWSAGAGAGTTGIVGFCVGGYVSFLAAARRRLGAAVTFYGGGIVRGRTEKMPELVSEIGGMETPWLGLFGDLDQGIPVDDVETLREALAQHASVETEIVRYPNADHGFHCEGRPQSYDPASAADGWQRTIDWFERYLVSG